MAFFILTSAFLNNDDVIHLDPQRGAIRLARRARREHLLGPTEQHAHLAAVPAVDDRLLPGLDRRAAGRLERDRHREAAARHPVAVAVMGLQGRPRPERVRRERLPRTAR
jgi:hypothetical protein